MVDSTVSMAGTAGSRAGSTTSPRPWYVFLSKPRQEAYAFSKLQEQGYEVLLPQMQSWVRQAGGWRVKSTVMFPRYGFVRPRGPEQSVGQVRSTPGVTCLVRFGPVLACMSAQKFDALLAVVAAQAASLPAQPFDPGQHVLFTSGPLKGLNGIVSSVAAERVQVLMTLLGHDHIVAAGARDLAFA